MQRRFLIVMLWFFLDGVIKTQAGEFKFKPPVNLGPPVNTSFTERDPYITADGQKLFFTSNYPDGDMDIWMSTWSGTGWNPPVNLGANVNSGLIEWSPSVSPDNKKLYFIAFGRPGSQGGWDVWMSSWDSVFQQWGVAQNLGPVINTPNVDWCPEISRNGQSLYYMSSGQGHPNGPALYVSRWNGSDWGVPEPFPLNINYTGTEERPSLTADENTMYFVRFNYFPRIYVTEKNQMGGWSQPMQLDSSINSPYGSSDPCITPDGKNLYFSSGRPGGPNPPGNSDIWLAERIIVPKVPSLRKELLLLLGTVLALTGIYWIKNRNP